LDLSIIPNLITLMRLLLVAPVAVAILNNEFWLTLVLFAIASVSDGVDGYLARRFNWTSRFGAILDPIADKLMLIVAFLLLTYIGIFPVWLALIVICRDMVIISGATVYHLMFGEYDFLASYLGKLSTLLQFSLVLVNLVNLAIFDMPEWLLEGGIWAVFVVSLLSGLHYVITWGRKAITASKAARHE
jgi:cardiolipin synthase